ncbi:MAG: S1C family serine protease [Acidimicrobiales bacterium]
MRWPAASSSWDDQPRDVTLLAAAPCDDLAVFKVADRSRLQTLALGSQSELKLGESVVAIGYPVDASRRDQLTATAAIVSVVRSGIDGRGGSPTLANVVQTDTAFNPGSSGGPLVNSRKQLVGVNTLTLPSSGGRTLQNSNYAIGVDRVKEVVATLRTGRSTAWTGASHTSPENAAALTSRGLPNQTGLLIIAAVPGTPAATAGLGNQANLLVAIDGKRIDSNVATYCDALKDVSTGQTVRFTLYQPNKHEKRRTCPSRWRDGTIARAGFTNLG